MDLREFDAFIKKEDLRLRKKYGNPSKRIRLLSRTVKLLEEGGEFANAIMLSMQDTRKEKLSKYKERHLEEEFADVVITSALIAKTPGLDIEKAVAAKVKKIDKRYQEKC